MITAYIETILLVIGIATASLIVQALAPKYALASFFGKNIEDDYALFLARAGGLPVAMIGLLLIWAAFDEAIRTPVIVAALIGKALFLAFIASNWRITGKGYALTIAVDGVAVLLLALYLLGF